MIDKLNLKEIIFQLIPVFKEAGSIASKLQKKGLEIKTKEDLSPVTNGDLKVNELITAAILKLTPGTKIISEETVDLKEKNFEKNFWLIDPIDGTKEYIAGKDEYTLNAALILNKKPVASLVGVPNKNRLFYTFGMNESYLIENDVTIKLSCSKKNKNNQIKAVSSVHVPSAMILNKLKSFGVNSIVKMSSSYKFCVVATGEFDIYAARERANEWDYAAGHAIAQNAGAIITTLNGEPIVYGKEDYKNQSLLLLRSKQLNA